MPEIPADLRYSTDHLWVRPAGGTSLVHAGVTDFAQQSLGDVVGVTLPPARGHDHGRRGPRRHRIGQERQRPDRTRHWDGRARNDDLARTPELVNTDPYGQGWMFEVETDPATLGQQLAALMDADAYRALAGA